MPSMTSYQAGDLILVDFLREGKTSQDSPFYASVRRFQGQLAEQWWTARDVLRVFPDHGSTWLFLSWLTQFSLGRKRLLDTLKATSVKSQGPSTA